MLNELISSLVRDIDRIGEQHPDFLYSYVTVKSATHDGILYIAEIHCPRTAKYPEKPDFKVLSAAATDFEAVKQMLDSQVKLELSKIRLLQAA